jgi:hypothetical protein
VERLVSEDGQLYACGNSLCIGEGIECTNCHYTDTAFLKLAKYEDAKLQPEQIHKLIEKNKLLAKENRKLKKEMLKMINYSWYSDQVKELED